MGALGTFPVLFALDVLPTLDPFLALVTFLALDALLTLLSWEASWPWRLPIVAAPPTTLKPESA